MARGGKNRKTAEEKRLAGTYRRDRDPSAGQGPEAASSVPPPPRGLAALDRRVWRELAAQVNERGSYTATRRTAFALMVTAVARLQGAKREPAYAFEKLLRAAGDALVQFGIAPVRAELPPPRRQPNELDEFTLRALPGGRGA